MNNIIEGYYIGKRFYGRMSPDNICNIVKTEYNGKTMTDLVTENQPLYETLIAKGLVERLHKENVLRRKMLPRDHISTFLDNFDLKK